MATATATLVEVRLDNEAGSLGIGVRLQLEDVRLQKDGLEQVVDMQLLLRGNLDEHVRSAPLLGDDAVVDQLLADAIGVGSRLVDLVDGHDDRHVSRLRMIDGLDGLRHDAVVSRDDEHDDVGDLCAAGAHGRERLVAGRVDEGDLPTVDVDHRSADVLRDAARLACGDAGVANSVEQRGLAVVDVSHDRDHRRTRLEVVLGVVVHDGVLLLGRDHTHLAAHVVGDELDHVIPHRLGERQNLAEHEQAFDDLVGSNAEQLGELRDRSPLRNLDDRVVEHEIGIEATLDGLELGTFARLGLAFLLALATATLALMRVGGRNGGAGFGEHLVALKLLGLNGHLRVTVLARLLHALELGNNLDDVTLSALLGTLRRAITARGGVLTRRSLLGALLLRLDALFLGLDLGKQRAEVGGALGSGRGCGGGIAMSGGRLAALALAVAQRLLDGLLLGDLGSGLRGAGAGTRLRLLALDALLLGLDLLRERLEPRAHRSLLERLFRGLGISAVLRTARAGGLALGELLLDGGAAGSLLLSAPALRLGLLLSEGLGLLVVDFTRALLHLGLELLTDLFDVGVSEHARMRLRRNLHLMKAIEHLLARHVEFLRQFMYSHARHISLLYPSRCGVACARERGLNLGVVFIGQLDAQGALKLSRLACSGEALPRAHIGTAALRASRRVEGDDPLARAHDTMQ